MLYAMRVYRLVNTSTGIRRAALGPAERTFCGRPADAGLGQPGRRAGFTLVELMVVIGILVILMAIAIPAATGLLESQRAKQTLATMDVLRCAIEQFAEEARITSKIGGVTPYSNVFGRYPPSPTVDLTGGRGAFTAGTDQATRMKFDQLVRELTFYDGGLYPPPTATLEDLDSSIECLVLFVNTFSTRAKQTLQNVQATAMTNADKDLVYKDVNASGSYDVNIDEAVDLFEVRDAWKRPIRYAVLSPKMRNNDVIFPARWELRSAGRDGQFAPPFTSAEDSDDVILRGPQND